MHADQVAVGGQPYVALERLGAGVERRRGRRRRVCSAFSWLAPRWATTCGLMRPSVHGPSRRCRLPAAPACAGRHGSAWLTARARGATYRPSRDHAARRAQPVRLRPGRHRPGRRLPHGRRPGRRPRRRPARPRLRRARVAHVRSAPRPATRSTASVEHDTTYVIEIDGERAGRLRGSCARPVSGSWPGSSCCPRTRGTGSAPTSSSSSSSTRATGGCRPGCACSATTPRPRRLYDRLGFVEVAVGDGVDDPSGGEVLMEWRACASGTGVGPRPGRVRRARAGSARSAAP